MHGANWTFIAWGAFHACLFLPLILRNKNRKNTDTVAENRVLPSLKELFQMLLTFGLVVIGWIFFRAETIGDAVSYLGGMAHLNLFSLSILRKKLALQIVISVFCMLIVEWLQRKKQHGLQIENVN